MPNKKSPLYNYRSPRDYKVFNMGNEASPPFKMKYSNSAFPFKSPIKKLDDPSVGDQSYAVENGESEKEKKKSRWSKEGAIAAIPGALSSLGATIISATRS